MIFAYLVAGIMIVSIVLSVYNEDIDYIFFGGFIALIASLVLFLVVLLGSCALQAAGVSMEDISSEPMELYIVNDKYYLVENSSDKYSYCYMDPEEGIKIGEVYQSTISIHYSKDGEQPYCVEETHKFRNPVLNFVFPLGSIDMQFYIPEGTIKLKELDE